MRLSSVISCAVSLLACCLLPAQLQTQEQASSKEELLGLQVPMRDGVHLATDVFLPAAGGHWPTVLIRTPYNRKSSASASYRYFVRRGYSVVIQDVRGRYASQGTFESAKQEGPDGSDAINWIVEQPWSNGRVAMAGNSYLGLDQWWAALEDNPHLLAISPMCSGDDEYLDRYYSQGGALKLGHRLVWLAQNLTSPNEPRLLFQNYIHHLPVRTADVEATGAPLPRWRDALNHPSYDAYWEARSVRQESRRINIPVLSFGGWFDNYAESDLDAFSRLSLQHTAVETWIGPWAHNPGLKFATRDFGPDANLAIRAKQADWFDRWVKKGASLSSGSAQRPVLHIFVMGPNVWREEHEWPLARTRYTPLYIGSNGHANSDSGDGVLQWAEIGKSHPDQFTYDPRNPVPTTGGAVCCDPKLIPPGPLNQEIVEKRPDVLVYTSRVLDQPTEITGDVRVTLYVATSANDTDFTAKLVDVQPDGEPLMVTDGIQRLRYRLSLQHPVFVKRNAVYQINIDAGVTSYVFMPGDRLRLEISSSNFPRFDRSLNSAGPNADQTKLMKARQTVFHDARYPSALVLPVISDERVQDATIYSPRHENHRAANPGRQKLHP